MSTFIDLTNRLLRRLNEVQIQDSDFISATGIQATAKDAIQDTLREINTRRLDWAFNAVEHTQILAVGVEEYAWEDNFAAVDWQSFSIMKSASLNVNTKPLKVISREEWYKLSKPDDYDSETSGRNIPDFVCPTHGNGFAVTPSPNQPYTVQYRYYKVPDDLVNSTDTTEIPPRFDQVIISGALTHMGLFKEDNELVAISQQKFERGLMTMVNMLTAGPEYMQTGVINRPGPTSGSTGFWWGY